MQSKHIKMNKNEMIEVIIKEYLDYLKNCNDEELKQEYIRYFGLEND